MTSRYRHGLLIGKFYPPHRGHHHLIETAATKVHRLTVLVLASAAETIPLDTRVQWLRDIHTGPNIEVIGGRNDIPMDLGDETIWAAQVANMKAVLAHHSTEPVDVILSSEPYGEELARWFGAANILIDLDRTTHPISGTAVRANLAEHWEDLHPVVRSGLTTRIVVLGSESTGTTTLSTALAEHYRARGGIWATTGWVPEYGRDYTYLKHDLAAAVAAQTGAPAPTMDSLVWDAADFARIAATQTDMENTAAQTGSPVLLCDTDAFATSVWERRYLGPDSHGAHHAATHLPPRTVYLLTDHHGVPFEQDGWRDGEHIRETMQEWFIDALIDAGHSWVLVTGTPTERLNLAVRVIDAVLARAATFGDPMSEPTILTPAGTS